MDTNSIITIVVVVIIVYIIIRLIVSPLIKIGLGILAVLVMLYILQQFFGFSFTSLFGPYGKYLDIKNLGLNLNWVLGPISYYVGKIRSFLSFIWGNFPKNQ